MTDKSTAPPAPQTAARIAWRKPAWVTPYSLCPAISRKTPPPPQRTRWWKCWKRKPQPHQDRPTPHEPEHGKAVMLGSMTAGMGVRTETYLKVTSSFLTDLIAYSFRTTMYPLASISSTFLSNPFAFSTSMVFPPIGINRRGLFSDGAYEWYKILIVSTFPSNTNMFCQSELWLRNNS